MIESRVEYNNHIEIKLSIHDDETRERVVAEMKRDGFRFCFDYKAYEKVEKCSRVDGLIEKYRPYASRIAINDVEV